MLCSNCRIIEICVKSSESGTCENGHYLCQKCMLQANEKCILCEGRVISKNESPWIHLEPEEVCNWTPDMIREWSLQNKFVDTEGTESVDDDLFAPLDECDATSMNLLYSRGEAYKVESQQRSDSTNKPDSKRNQHLSWNDVYSKDHGNFSKNGHTRNKPIPNRFPKLACIEDRSAPIRKDTRQNLVEQTREEIREKIMQEIFNTFKNDPRSTIRPKKYTYIKQFQTIGVSTESTPRLLPAEGLNTSSGESSKETMAKLTKTEPNQLKEDPQEILVMNVETKDIPSMPIPNELKKKKPLSSIDLKLQQIMGTILESVGEKPNNTQEEEHFYKYIRDKFSHMPLKKLEEIISSIHNQEDKSITQVTPPCQSDSLPKRLTNIYLASNCHRAFYDPPIAKQAESAPNPQFQQVTFSNLKTYSNQAEVVDASTLNIPRSPIICPISTCQRAFFVSDFTKHIAVDHTKVPIERILPHQCKNFFLDPKLIHFGVSRCQVLLLVKDKIRNLGHEKFKDFIPILVMTTKVSLLEICCNNYRSHSEEVKNNTQNFIMIWLTGIMPPQLPIFFSMTVWARSGYMPTCHIVHSGRLYSVRNPQSPEMVRNSGQMLLLSENQVDLLTNRGRHMLELQIAVN